MGLSEFRKALFAWGKIDDIGCSDLVLTSFFGKWPCCEKGIFVIYRGIYCWCIHKYWRRESSSCDRFWMLWVVSFSLIGIIRFFRCLAVRRLLQWLICNFHYCFQTLLSRPFFNELFGENSYKMHDD